MKQLLSSCSLILALAVMTAVPIAMIIATNDVRAQANDLYYNVGGRKIPLVVQTDAIAVSMSQVRGAKETNPMSLLQQDFGAGETRGEIRSGSPSTIVAKVQPLNQKYAILTAIKDPFGGTKLKQQAETKPYIDATLPVLKIPGTASRLVLPNETIVKFKPGISAADRDAILTRNQFDPKSATELQFARGFYLVKSTAKGLAVLAASNQLGKIPGVQSSMPNFIQVQSTPDLSRFGINKIGIPKIKSTVTNPGVLTGLVNLRPLQWHIDSRPMLGAMNLTNRTDVRAPEVWNRGKKGDGVLVAVIDSLIQWDHPALANRIATVNCNNRKFTIPCQPGEVHGWDFSDDLENDNDTRVSAAELKILRPEIEDSLKSDGYIQVVYANAVAKYKTDNPGVAKAVILAQVRSDIRDDVAGNFHGTMSTGMIAGNGSSGFQGIAPNVKILPVRVSGLGDSYSIMAILNGLTYAADRGADVINMSFGGPPFEPVEALIAELQTKYPKLVFVAAAGNETTPASIYPAAYPNVISVGAIDIKGNRASYSNWGKRLDVVAPGGDTNVEGGVLTLSGVGADGFWQRDKQASGDFTPFQDRRGYYIFTQGTSFASPAVAGVIALMKSADPQRKLTAEQYRQILLDNSSHKHLSLTSQESKDFATARTAGNAPNVSPAKFYFGNGLVNAEKAVARVERIAGILF
jgi:serine protease